MKTIEIFFTKRDGEIINKKAVRNAFDSVPENGRFVLKIEAKNKRTLPMNAYLHGVLIPEFKNALRSVGYEVRTDAQAKSIMKETFLKVELDNGTGGKISYTKDTHDLTTEEMSILFDEVIRFCAINMNYQIAYPNEQLEIFA